MVDWLPAIVVIILALVALRLAWPILAKKAWPPIMHKKRRAVSVCAFHRFHRGMGTRSS